MRVRGREIDRKRQTDAETKKETVLCLFHSQGAGTFVRTNTITMDLSQHSLGGNQIQNISNISHFLNYQLASQIENRKTSQQTFTIAFPPKSFTKRNTLVNVIQLVSYYCVCVCVFQLLFTNASIFLRHIPSKFIYHSKCCEKCQLASVCGHLHKKKKHQLTSQLTFGVNAVLDFSGLACFCFNANGKQLRKQQKLVNQLDNIYHGVLFKNIYHIICCVFLIACNLH